VCSWQLDQSGRDESRTGLGGAGVGGGASGIEGGSGSEGGIRGRFFIPRDWVSAEVLSLCRLLADGTVLCPRRGEVAVIRSSLGVGV
jgi:hypothetical protein